MLGGWHFTEAPCQDDRLNERLLEGNLPLQAVLTAGRKRRVSIGVHQESPATLRGSTLLLDRFSYPLNARGPHSGDHGCAKVGKLEDRQSLDNPPGDQIVH
jgi:hypothetical protein